MFNSYGDGIEYVYFIMRAGEPYVKIGTTNHLYSRMFHYKGQYLLGVVQGYFEVERATHARFDHLRVHPFLELFQVADDLMLWILEQTHQDVNPLVWGFVRRFPREIFNDLIGQDIAQYRQLGDGEQGE
jgi:hypothetical protein